MSVCAKVSVIVPVYNAGNIICKTLEMITESTLSEIEILAVNDGSTDNSLQIIREFAKRDNRIKVIDKSNGGVFDARNRGIEEASGEYVCFCDQDDFVELEMFEKMYYRVKKDNCELIMCSTGKIIENNKKVPDYVLPDAIFIEENIRSECFLPLIFNRCNLYQSKSEINISGTIWKCMIMRKFIEDNHLKFRSYVSYEDDRLFLLDVLARAQRVAMIPDILYYWTVDSASESHTPKYIDDLHEKDIKLQNAIIDIMKVADCENKYIQLFENFNGAFRYSRIVENEVNHQNITRAGKLELIKKIYEEKNFKTCVKYAKFFSENLAARRFVCFFLSEKMIDFAYLFWSFYSKVRSKFQNQRFWIKSEKKLMTLSNK